MLVSCSCISACSYRAVASVYERSLDACRNEFVQNYCKGLNIAVRIELLDMLVVSIDKTSVAYWGYMEQLNNEMILAHLLQPIISHAVLENCCPNEPQTVHLRCGCT